MTNRLITITNSTMQQTALEAVRTRRAKQQLAETTKEQGGVPIRVPSVDDPAKVRTNRPPQPLPPSSSRTSRAASPRMSRPPSPRRLRAASPARLSSRPPSPRLSKPASPRLSRTPSLKELATLMPRYQVNRYVSTSLWQSISILLIHLI